MRIDLFFNFSKQWRFIMNSLFEWLLPCTVLLPYPNNLPQVNQSLPKPFIHRIRYSLHPGQLAAYFACPLLTLKKLVMQSIEDTTVPKYDLHDDSLLLTDLLDILAEHHARYFTDCSLQGLEFTLVLE